VTETAAGERRAVHPVALATVAAYGIIGALLVGTRLVGLDRSYWHDEVLTVIWFVREGPREILTGFYLPNNHQLFSLFGWATSSLFGESEIALRFWSVVPFIAGALLVTAWLHVRVGALTGVLYLFFVTCSPLLLDLSRQARGYGLAFLAMSVLLLAALEADRTGRTWAIAAVCVAGVVGTWTLPIFGLAFVATACVLLARRELRRRVAVGLAASLLAIGVWYAPHVDDLLRNSQQEFGGPIPWFGIVTAPIDQTIIPALLWIEGLGVEASLVWLPVTAALALLLLSSPLLRDRRTALILCSGVAATLLVVWVTRLFLVPRFVSFLLVPLFVLLASGVADVLGRIPTRPAWARTVVALLVLAILSLQFVDAAERIARLPREAQKDVAAFIAREGPDGAPVLAYTHRPQGLSFYLGRPVVALEADEVEAEVCGRDETVVYVTYKLEPVEVSCLSRVGVRGTRFDHYARGEATTVWFVPPAA
jgi:hypothetical protein